jgi:hypothetical protein
LAGRGDHRHGDIRLRRAGAEPAAARILVSSSLLTHYKESAKAEAAVVRQGWPTTGSGAGQQRRRICHCSLYGLQEPPWLFAAFVGAMAEANADLGDRAGRTATEQPRLITSGACRARRFRRRDGCLGGGRRRVDRRTGGAVLRRLALLSLGDGLLGYFDNLLGATIQAFIT